MAIQSNCAHVPETQPEQDKWHNIKEYDVPPVQHHVSPACTPGVRRDRMVRLELWTLGLMKSQVQSF